MLFRSVVRVVAVPPSRPSQSRSDTHFAHDAHLFRCRPCSHMLDPPHSLQCCRCLPCPQMPLPPHSTHLFRCLPCPQMPLPPQSLHSARCLRCSHIPLPPQSLHRYRTRPCEHTSDPPHSTHLDRCRPCGHPEHFKHRPRGANPCGHGGLDADVFFVVVGSIVITVPASPFARRPRFFGGGAPSARGSASSPDAPAAGPRGLRMEDLPPAPPPPSLRRAGG